jgi:hypothetical protein
VAGFVEGRGTTSDVPSLPGDTWRFWMAAVQEEEGDNRRRWASVAHGLSRIGLKGQPCFFILVTGFPEKERRKRGKGLGRFQTGSKHFEKWNLYQNDL